MTATMLAEPAATKGDLPGHPFRGNQWEGGGTMALDRDSGSGVADDEYGNANYGEENRKKAKWKVKKGIAQGPPGTAGQFEFEAKVKVWEQTEDPYTYSAEAVHVRQDGKWMRSSGSSDEAPSKATKQAMAELGSKLWYDNPKHWKEGTSPIEDDQKSPSRLAIVKQLLSVATKAVRLKQLLLKDQLRNAVVKAVHLKQYAETEAELTDAMAGLIKRQFKQASKSVSEKGGTKFDPRDWDSDLIDTCLPILMRKAGEAAAAQMLIMGVDVAPRKKVGRTKGDLPGHPFRGNQWGGGRRQTDTPEFKAWFGDSKVVDENGDPMVVFHGTTSEFTSFDSSAPRSTDPGFFGRGIYFSPDPAVASNYASGLGVGEEKPGGNVMPVYIRMVKPLVVDRGKGLQAAMKKAGMKPSYQPDADTAILKEHGYDGVMVYMKSRGEKGPGELTEIIAFDPSQIKSATGNRGTFDPKDPDMNKSPSFTSIKTTATDWLLENADLSDDLLWPEVFTLPSGAVVDMGFATEWPDWMKAEISKQMRETFEQPFWAGINDTTSAGIQSHVERGLLDGLSIREIQQQMVGDGLDEYYHNRGQNIARTESGSALNGARSAAMDRLAEEVPGLRVKRTWMSVLGTTTRSTHASLDGVPADRDGGWYLGGVHVPWPAHWNLPAGERCNCQCTIVQQWGQSDETASELIEEYNERLDAERSLRRLWEKTEKGDKPGHPFRGNQWSGGRTGAEHGGSTDYGVDAALAVLQGRQPDNAATSVRKIDQSSVKSDSKLGAGGVNEVRVVEIEDADGVTRKYCFKPDDGENPYVSKEYKGRTTSNEVASSVIDEAMGLGMVARTEMAEIGGRKGSLQEWVNDDATVAKNLVKYNEDGEPRDYGELLKVDGVDDMLALDVLTGNSDRHYANWLVKDGRAKLIDNGFSMATNDQYARAYDDGRLFFRTMELAGDNKFRQFRPISDKFKNGLSKMLKSKDETDAKLKAAGVGDEQRASFWKRAEYMSKLGRGFGYGDGTLAEIGKMAEGRQMW